MTELTLDGDETSMALEATLSTNFDGETRELGRGALIGRYVVLDLAGAGAMGLVLAAYDPELDRKVALKLLKVTGTTARSRLQREAQALAKLDHPNVVTVYDVGTHEGQLFTAMEFVEGKTLGRWLSEVDAPRSWREVVRVLADAGEGLAAAHEAGLVHRDFKPDNVMLGDDGRVRVMDFGLARATSLDTRDEAPANAQPEIDHEASGTDSSTRALSRSLTRTGALMGTPAYMSPEQFEGRPADPLSDQFNFCVTLYQALYGERPFEATSLALVIESSSRGQVRPAPRGSKVPPWLRKVVVRGLAANPNERWPSMRALLQALASDPALRRRKLMSVALALGLVGATTVTVASMADDEPSLCAGLDRKLTRVWNEERSAAVSAAMIATNLSYAPGTAERVRVRLDAYADAWVTARTDACEASQRGEQSDHLLDLRMACLDNHLRHLDATVDVLVRADATAVESAVAAVDKLPNLTECADVERLLSVHTGARDPRSQHAIGDLERRIIAARALENLGKFDEALALARAVVRDADELDDDHLRVRANQALGSIQHGAGDYEAAKLSLQRAYSAAIVADMPEQAAAASRRLVDVTGSARGLAHPDEGRAWALHAKAFTQASGTPEDLASYELSVGDVAAMAGEYAEAREHFERALASFEQLRPDHYGVVAAISRLASAASFAGAYDDARRYYERALTVLEQTLDPTHPDIGRLYLSLGENARQQQHYDEALEHLQSAQAVFEQALSDEHPLLGYTLSSLGYVQGWRGEFDEARAYLRRAQQIFSASVGSDHYYALDAETSLGSVAYLAGDYAEAKAHYERVQATTRRTMGPDHPSVGYALINLAEVSLAELDYDAARTHAQAALEILEPKLGRQHPDLMLSLEILGKAELGLGRPAAAIAPLTRALEPRTGTDDPSLELAQLRFALARALWDAPLDAGQDRKRARELAELAATTLAESGQDRDDHGAEIDAWLREHP